MMERNGEQSSGQGKAFSDAVIFLIENALKKKVENGCENENLQKKKKISGSSSG